MLPPRAIPYGVAETNIAIPKLPPRAIPNGVAASAKPKMDDTNAAKALKAAKANIQEANVMKATKAMKVTKAMKAVKAMKAKKLDNPEQDAMDDGTAAKGSHIKKGKTMKSQIRTTKRKPKSSKIGKGKRAKSMVLRGLREKTVGGLTKDHLFKNKRGKVVSKKASGASNNAFSTSNFGKWNAAVKAARLHLKCEGFTPVGGGTILGKALYAKAKALYTM